MDRPLHQPLPDDSVANPNPVRAEQDPWGLAEAPEAAGPDVSLGDLTRSNVAVNVVEAIAIVREICWLSNDPPAVMFDLEKVALRASGDVVGRPIPTSDPSAAVQSVAKVLQALISRTLVPPKLQELVAAATTDTQPYRSFAEFGDALRPYQAPNGRELIRGVYLRSRSSVAPSSAAGRASALSKRLKSEISRRLQVVALVWASVRSRFLSDRRVVAGLALVVIACASLIALSRYDFSRSTGTESAAATASGATTAASGTTEKAPVGPLASAFNTALGWIGMGSVSPVKSEEVAPIPEKKTSKSRPTARAGNSSRPLQPTPLRGSATDAPASLDAANVNAAAKLQSEEAAAVAQDDPSGETSIVYSADDTEVAPPVPVRVPGIVTDRSNKDQNVSLIDILVSETGDVETVLGRPRPATLGATLQSTTALSVVKTWRFRPALKNGQPVKYRTTVPFIETVYRGGRD
jgi:hypothetical protein